MSSEKSTGSRSQLDEAANPAADVRIDTPTSVQLSPGLVLSPTEAVNSFVIGSRNGLHGSAPLSEGRNTVRTVPEDTTWSINTDRDGPHHLPRAPVPTDISNVSSSDAFSWPLFTADTDWEFDFDIPFTTEHTSASTDASSTALNELEVSQYYNRPAPAFDPTADSGQLIEYLSLGEKVSTYTAFLA